MSPKARTDESTPRRTSSLSQHAVRTQVARVVRIVFILLAVVLALGALTACSDVGGTGDLDYVAGDGRVVQVPTDEREDPIDVSGETVQGEPLTAKLNGKKVTLTDAKGNTATVTTADVMQSNGVIHVIDKVLMP